MARSTTAIATCRRRIVRQRRRYASVCRGSRERDSYWMHSVGGETAMSEATVGAPVSFAQAASQRFPVVTSAASQMADHTTPLVRNCWYVAGLGSEITRALQARTLLGK